MVQFSTHSAVETVQRGAEPRLAIYTQDARSRRSLDFLLRKVEVPDLVGLDAASADWLTRESEQQIVNRCSDCEKVFSYAVRSVSRQSHSTLFIIAGR